MAKEWIKVWDARHKKWLEELAVVPDFKRINCEILGPDGQPIVSRSGIGFAPWKERENERPY